MKIVASDGSQKNLTHSSMIFLLMFIILKINKVGGRNFGCSTSHPLNPKKNENKIKILSFLYVSLFFFIIFFFPSMEGYPHDSGLFTITNSQKIWGALFMAKIDICWPFFWECWIIMHFNLFLNKFTTFHMWGFLCTKENVKFHEKNSSIFFSLEPSNFVNKIRKIVRILKKKEKKDWPWEIHLLTLWTKCPWAMPHGF